MFTTATEFSSVLKIKGGSRYKNLCMTRVLGFLIRFFSNYYTLHRSDLAARAAPLDPRLKMIDVFNKGKQYLKINDTLYNYIYCGKLQ